MNAKLNRRSFIGGTALAVAYTTAGCATCKRPEKTESAATEIPAAQPAAPATEKPLLASGPVLQNAADTSMGVAFAVNADASGWVEYATTPDMKGAVKVFSGEHGLMNVDDKIALVRLTGLKPATRYYYRFGADRISFKGGYQMKNLGPVTDGKVRSFTTLGTTAKGGFCVINDTHEQQPALALAFDKLQELKPAAVIWNGDASNTSETVDKVIDVFLRPHPDYPEFAAEMPYLFLNGNHDFRGRANRKLGEVEMYREATERRSEYAELGRNFVQRIGDVALIGLDTGEDKQDTNPRFAGLFKMTPYREKQARWLAEAIETEAVRTAKFKVAFCHIPLFDPRPRANPGDIMPDDASPLYDCNYAAWQRTCAKLWSPSFKKAGVQLVIAAHQHRFRYDAPTAERPWAQIVGGGPEMGIGYKWHKDGTSEKVARPDLFPTVIEGQVKDNALVVKVHNLLARKIVGEYQFPAKA